MADRDFLKEAEYHAAVGLSYLESLPGSRGDAISLLHLAQDKFDTAARCVQAARIDMEVAERNK